MIVYAIKNKGEKNFETLKDKYVAPDLHIDLRKEKLNSTFKLYKFLKEHYKNIN